MDQKSLHQFPPMATISIDGEGWPTVAFWKLCGCQWLMDTAGRVLSVRVCPEAGPQPEYDPAQASLELGS